MAEFPDLDQFRLTEAQKATLTSEKPEPMLQFFTYAHLPEQLQAVSRPFCVLAEQVAASYPRNPERTVTLRKLLEAKDAAVRTWIYTTGAA